MQTCNEIAHPAQWGPASSALLVHTGVSSTRAPRVLATSAQAEGEKGEKKRPSVGEIFSNAAARAAQGGTAGAIAMASQVLALMWMRTTINYQYRYGLSTMDSFRALYKDGGIPRFYRGLGPALLQGPLSRFGDTAANTGAIALLNGFEVTENLPIMVKTAAASFLSGMFRVILMPVDTFKTVMQVEGKDGVSKLMTKFRAKGPTVFFHGAMAAWAANTVGHYPWFAMYNYLSETLPRGESTVEKLGRQALIGFCSSAVSDTCSNSIRVVKVYKQANTEAISYPEAVRRVIKESGLSGLFGRGLSTKIVSNGLQGLMFSVLWKLIDEQLYGKK